MAYQWSEGAPDTVELRIRADRPIYFLSDLHIGDGSSQDAFMGKDRALIALLEQVQREGARLIICGDFVDFHQAWNLTRVLQAHGKLLRVLSDLAARTEVFYITGNHDDDIRIYRDILRFQVCTRLWIELPDGTQAVVQHGHEFDPYIGRYLKKTHLATQAHHLVERLFGTWLRLPLVQFYFRGPRIFLWLCHKLWCLGKPALTLLAQLGWSGPRDGLTRYLSYWIGLEVGDPMKITRPAMAFGRAVGAAAVVCGHSHMPGNVVHEGVRYINTGSWTFNWAQYTTLIDGAFTTRDWLSGRTYTDALYRPLLEGELSHVDLDRWWRNQYLGWLRFRSGELSLRREAP